MTHPLAGIYAAAVTPMCPDFTPEIDAIPPLMDFFAHRGCHGILLLGTTGEGPSFSPEERAAIFRAGIKWRETNPDIRLFAGTGTPSLSETVALTRLAFDLGFDGVVVLPPYYYRKATDVGLFTYFAELIRRGVPEDGNLLGYHFPGVAGIGFSVDLLARLKDSFPRQFAGIKDSSHDESFVRTLGVRFGDDLVVLNGTDSYLQLALENHSAGAITAPANLISPQLRAVWDAHLRGEDATALQARVTEARHIMEKYPPFPPLLKALLARKHGLPRWPVRPPLEGVGEAALEQAWKELDGLI
jgi:4-hydroxy-tetrahydrodipicolinate synthase